MKLLQLTMTPAKDLTPALLPGAEPPSTDGPVSCMTGSNIVYYTCRKVYGESIHTVTIAVMDGL